MFVLLPPTRTLTIVLLFDLPSNASIHSLISTVNSQCFFWRLDQLTEGPAATQLGMRFGCAACTILPPMIAARESPRQSKGFDVGQLDVKSSSNLRGIWSRRNGLTSWLVGEDNFRSSRFTCLPWQNLHLLQLLRASFLLERNSNCFPRKSK